MDIDRLEALRQHVAQLERELADLDGLPEARERLRATLDELHAVMHALREREMMLAAQQRAFESDREHAGRPGDDPFQNAFAQAPIGMALVGVDGRTFKVNRALCDMLGYSEEEVLAGRVVDVADPGEIDRAVEYGRRLLAGEIRTYEIEKRFRHSAGHVVRLMLSVSLGHPGDGEKPYFICQFVDITERKRTEEALSESEQRFENAFRYASVGMAIATVDGCLWQVNQALCSLLGYSQEELLGKTIYDVTHPDDVPPSEAAIHQLLAGEIQSFRFEKRYLHKQGHSIWGLVNVSLVRDAAGTPRYFISQILDINERRKAEDALRKSEERFRALVENAFDAVFVIGANRRLIYASPSTTRVFGYETGKLVENDVHHYVHPDDQQAVDEFLADVAQTPVKLAIGDIRIRHRDGHWVWIEGIAQNLRENPHIGAVVVNAHDISERKQAEEALRARESRFRALMENSSDVVSLVTTAGDMLYVGPSINHLLGYDTDELVGRNGFDFIHSEDRERTRRLLTELGTTPGEMVTIPFRFRHKNGSWRWMESIFTNLLEEPSVAAIIVSSRDITDRRKAEILLRESEERFALAVAGANDGLWDWDLLADKFYASPRLRAILGFDEQEDIPRPEVLGLRIHPDDLERVTTEFMKHINGISANYEAEYRQRHNDGTYRWVLARGLSVSDTSGKPYRIVGSLSDVTARKQAEEYARDRQAELAHVLRVSAMGEMAAGLAHEINQPLAAIVNFARGSIHRLHTGQPTDEVVDALKRIANEALRAGGIVRGLRQFLRKEPPRHASADLNSIVADAIRLVEPDARRHGVAIRAAFTDGMPTVQVDQVQIQQVIVNLIRNGLEAMDRCNGTRRELSVRTSIAGSDAITVAVRDAGEGLPEGGDKIFDPFFTTKPNGLGMGLSISRSIIHAHGGRIWSSANPEGGATFSFTIPIGAAV